MTIKLASLRVSADFDASAYARGASQKAASDDLMIRSGDALGASLAKADQNLDRSIPGMARLSRSYIDGYSQAEKFEKALLQVGNAMDKGMSPDRAVAMLINLENQFHRVADAAALAQKGLGNVTSVVNTAHVDQTGLNGLLGTNTGTSRSASDSAAVFEQAAQEQQRLAKAAELLRMQVNPLAAAQTRLNAELAEYSAMAQAGVITTEELSTAQTMASQRFSKVSDDVKRHTGNLKLSNFELVNLHYQLSDIGVSLAAGQNPFTVMMQQGSQIAQIFEASGTSALGSLKAVGAGILTYLTNPTNIAILGFGALLAGGVMAFKSIHNELPSIDDLLKKQKNDVDELQQGFGNVLKQMKFINSEASNVIKFKVQIDQKDTQDSLKRQVDDILTEIQPRFMIVKGQALGVNQQFSPFAAEIKELKQSLASGKPDLVAFREEIVKMLDAAGDDSKLKQQVKTLLAFSDAAAEAERQAKSLEDQARYNDTFKGSSIRVTAPLIGNADQQMVPLSGFIRDNRSDRQKIEETTTFIMENAKSYGEAADAAAKYAKGIGQLNAELDKQRQLDALDLKALDAATPAQKSYVAAQRERILALNTSADAQTTDLRATMAAKTAYQQAAFALTEAAKVRMMTANDNIGAAQLEIGLIGKSAAQRDLATANLKTYQDLQKTAFTNGMQFNEAEYEALMKMNEQHAKLIEKLSVETALYNLNNEAKWAGMNPLAADIDRKMQATGVTEGTAEYKFLKLAMQDAQAASRTFVAGARSAFYEIENTITDLGTTTKDFFSGVYSAGESMFENFAKTGKVNMADLESFMLESLGKITYQFAVSGLLNGTGLGGLLNSLFGGTATVVGGSLYNAKGNAFGSGLITAFGSGGAFTNSIVTRPTAFAYGGGFGKLGVMGEAGPEAVMPLARGRDGKLGIAANNNTPVSISHNVDVHYYGQAQPDISTSVDSMGRLQVIIREIARAEAASTIQQVLPSQYGVIQRRVQR